ncbi:LRRN4 C-terminal-like protein [Oryzias melastigma]|uniref:LRRN4 C-terminal-like protein n=1 Tax=Oryzias melastigma TaxID=30732 RepID=UPI000CF7C17A|nr:LRRN4 C-terminal-like protein [Oryzias melastigma]XP_036070001.1 LRRN4 C-terminal-like protein [Oryzias melastigma]
MASLQRFLAALLVFVPPVIHDSFFSSAASTSPPNTRHQIEFVTGLVLDYNYGDNSDDSPNPDLEVRSSVRTPIFAEKPQYCKYDACLEDQEPCDQLAMKFGCLCPGMSGSEIAPHPPFIKALLPVTDGDNRGKIEVQWCAPSSEVTSYRVVVEGTNIPALEVGKASRKGLVGSLEVGTKVCVEAVNDAGQSTPSEFSCKRYDHTGSSGHELLALVIGGGIGLLLLLIVTSVIFWKFQLCRKAKRPSSNRLGNP